MMLMIKYNGEELVKNILLASSFKDRLIGLMFRQAPPQKSNGLLIEPCNSIHTCFMKYSLDVIFLDSKNKIIKIIYNLKPWRFTWIYLKASKTLEVPAGYLKKNLREGESLEVIDV
jgi:uncharacterized membrane protein (UPF0127 family)